MEKVASFSGSSDYRHSDGLYYDEFFSIGGAGRTAVAHVWELANTGQLIWASPSHHDWFVQNFGPGSPGQNHADRARVAADEAEARRKREEEAAARKREAEASRLREEAAAAEAARRRASEIRAWPLDRLKFQSERLRSEIQRCEDRLERLEAEMNHRVDEISEYQERHAPPWPDWADCNIPFSWHDRERRPVEQKLDELREQQVIVETALADSWR